MLGRHPAHGATALAQLNEALLKGRGNLTKFQQRSPPGGGNSCTKILKQKRAGVANDSVAHDKKLIKGRGAVNSLPHSLSLPLPLCLLLRSIFYKRTGDSFSTLCLSSARCSSRQRQGSYGIPRFIVCGRPEALLLV